jgi:NADH:ubiquinone oxidoreductase subunit 6 (subunit J)
MYGSMFLIGAALAVAGGFGVFLPPGFRSGVLLALLAGAGVGIAGLAVNSSILGDSASIEDQWRAFFISSVAGFATVLTGLVVTWRRAKATATAAPRVAS